MAYGRSSHQWIRLLFPVIILALLFFSFHAEAKIHQGGKGSASSVHHPSNSYHDRRAKKGGQKRRPVSALHLEVKRQKIVSLKKSSFLNKRPYQFATPVVTDGKLYVGCDAGTFSAIDLASGKELWEYKAKGPIHAKAALQEETVYFGDSQSSLYALDIGSGAERWKIKLDGEILTTPLILGARLYIADLSGRLYAIDRQSGVESWHTDPSDRNIGFSVRRASSPAAADGAIIIGTASGSVVAYRESDGSIKWVRQLGDRRHQICDVDSTPLISGGKIFVSSADGKTAALDPASGQVLWMASAGGVNDVMENGGKLYVAGQGVLSSLDPSSGDILWQQDLGTPEISTPVAGERYIAVASTVDKFYLIDRENGDIAYDRAAGKGSFGDPIIADNKLYLLTNTSELLSFSVKEKASKAKR